MKTMEKDLALYTQLQTKDSSIYLRVNDNLFEVASASKLPVSYTYEPKWQQACDKAGLP
jgi:hypothetical protein